MQERALNASWVGPMQLGLSGWKNYSERLNCRTQVFRRCGN
jgi:hypothetical protein